MLITQQTILESSNNDYCYDNYYFSSCYCYCCYCFFELLHIAGRWQRPELRTIRRIRPNQALRAFFLTEITLWVNIILHARDLRNSWKFFANTKIASVY